MQSMHLHSCPGCGALLSNKDGPVHKYMESSPACWAAFGQVLAREYSSSSLYSVHRLTVDSYATQHPGGHSRQAIQSVGVHLTRLCLFLERDLSAENANAEMLRIARTKSRMTHLSRPSSLGDITVLDVLAATCDAAHRETVREWARSTWNAWQEHHPTLRMWIDTSQDG